MGRAGLDLVMGLDSVSVGSLDASDIIRYHQTIHGSGALYNREYEVISQIRLKFDDRLSSGMEGNRIGSLSYLTFMLT